MADENAMKPCVATGSTGKTLTIEVTSCNVKRIDLKVRAAPRRPEAPLPGGALSSSGRPAPLRRTRRPTGCRRRAARSR